MIMHFRNVYVIFSRIADSNYYKSYPHYSVSFARLCSVFSMPNVDNSELLTDLLELLMNLTSFE